jgi:hypothetical protein
VRHLMPLDLNVGARQFESGSRPAEPPVGSLDADEVSWRRLWVGRDSVDRRNHWLRARRCGHQVTSPGPKRSSVGQTGGLPVIPAPLEAAWGVAATVQAGSIKSAATPGDPGTMTNHDLAPGGVRAGHDASAASERISPSRRP